jgi:hypothetical protein
MIAVEKIPGIQEDTHGFYTNTVVFHTRDSSILYFGVQRGPGTSAPQMRSNYTLFFADIYR